MRKTLITVGALITASILALWVGFSAASSAAVQSPAGTAVTGTRLHPAQAAPTPDPADSTEPAESAEPKGDTAEGAIEQGETADSTEPAESAEPKGDTAEGATEQGETADGTNQKGEAGEQEDGTAQDAAPEGSAG
ncbi:hypothetical protein [Streptosporangium subroseum]|uniref:hypothetical protein n=1 Tax=Streptosporangium subroseum TaxID=106412 RepID=UPI0030898AEB|nr:hypothetical protein OHB15_23470 [Streptosporangium subroseum]